jgi:hypothetical protein
MNDQKPKPMIKFFAIGRLSDHSILLAYADKAVKKGYIQEHKNEATNIIEAYN